MKAYWKYIKYILIGLLTVLCLLLIVEGMEDGWMVLGFFLVVLIIFCTGLILERIKQLAPKEKASPAPEAETPSEETK